MGKIIKTYVACGVGLAMAVVAFAGTLGVANTVSEKIKNHKPGKSIFKKRLIIKLVNVD